MCPWPGPIKPRNLVTAFPEIKDIFTVSKTDLCRVEGIDVKTAAQICSNHDLDLGQKELEKAAKYEVTILSLWEKAFPNLLKKIYDPPAVLYCRGLPLQTKEDCIAIVGTRAITPYGRAVTKQLAAELSAVGLTIVSGMARCIDTAAHKATLEGGSRTIAVLGCGVDRVYTAENKQVMQYIIELGTVISVFPFVTKPEGGNFPQRNRIISGLSHGTIIVEAGHRSGAILTAFNAIDQNREVFAVSGRIADERSKSANRLIRNRVILVGRTEHVLQAIEPQLTKRIKPRQRSIDLNLSDEERSIFTFLEHSPIHIDELVKKSEMDLTILLTILLSLELKGAVLQFSGKQFVRA